MPAPQITAKRITIFKLINYSGLIAFLFLVASAILGFTGFNFRLHKMAGTATLLFALIHVGLVFYKNLKLKMRR